MATFGSVFARLSPSVTCLLLGSACDLSRFSQDLPDALTAKPDVISPVNPGPSDTSHLDAALPTGDAAVSPPADVEPVGDAEPTDASGADTVRAPECGPGSQSPLPDPCEDYNPCTSNLCEEGRCIHAPIPSCCREDSLCDDGISCTEDLCNRLTNRCEHIRSDSFCCISPEDCRDGDPCTEDVCAAHRCVHPRKPACPAAGPAICSDQNDCTSESWSSNGLCSYVPASAAGDACCTEAADCPVVAGQEALCQEHRCLIVASSCEGDLDCRGTGPCSSGRCSSGRCVRPENCCETDVACDDGLEATRDRCLVNRCVHALGTTDVSCVEASECEPDSRCLSMACEAGLCSATPREGAGCCRTAEDCPSAGRCGVAACVDFSCQQSALATPQPIWSADFTTLDGWSVAADATGAAWRLGTSQFTSAPSGLFYGLQGGGYQVGSRSTAGSILGPPVSLPASVPSSALKVRFWRNLRVEAISSRDTVKLHLVRDGQQDILLWDKEFGTGAGLSWRADEVAMPAGVSGTVRFRFSFDTIDGVDNGGQGVFIDDLLLLAPCP
jgi:hypothetical protein